MRRVDDQVMHDFVARRFGELRRTAYLMCGDWDLAEAAAETALAKVVADGGHGRPEHLDAQARRALMAAFHHDRRRSKRERIFTAPAGHHAGPGATDDPAVTIPVLAALRQLPPKRQAVVVLSCWQKLGARETAAALGISVRSTRGHARRGIAALRDRLRDLVPGAGDTMTAGLTGPASTEPASTEPEPAGPRPTGSGSTGSGSTGPESTGPGSTGSGSTGPESTGPGSADPVTAGVDR